VAAKWFLEEPHTPEAVALRDAHAAGRIRLLAPMLLLYEVANALRYHPRVGSEWLSVHIADLVALDIGLEPPDEVAMEAAVRCAYRTGVAIYDAAYLALAERIDAVLVTADSVQLEAADDRGVHVKDWAEPAADRP
jgi:predicted nucleic acid-binding protein